MVPASRRKSAKHEPPEKVLIKLSAVCAWLRGVGALCSVFGAGVSVWGRQGLELVCPPVTWICVRGESTPMVKKESSHSCCGRART